MRLLAFLLTIVALLVAPPGHGQVDVKQSESQYTVAVETKPANDGEGIFPKSVSVFTGTNVSVDLDGPLSSALRAKKIPIAVYSVSLLEEAEKQISQGLSNDPEVAKEQLSQRLQQDQIPTESLKVGWYAIVMARQLRITKLPAFVFDGNRIVYGESGLDNAVRDYQRFRAGGGD